jgi:hypothetical protein
MSINKTDSFVISWRVWFNDLSDTITEYNSIEHDLTDLPSDGFQAMRLWYSDGRGRFISGNDYYFFALHPSGTIFGQSNDTYEDIVARYPEVIICRGKHTTDQMMIDINNLMNNSTNPLN